MAATTNGSILGDAFGVVIDKGTDGLIWVFKKLFLSNKEHYDFAKFFNNCGIKNKDEEIPLLYDSEVDELDDKHFTFTAPLAITTKHFEENKEALSFLLNTDEDNITVEKSGKMIRVIVTDNGKYRETYDFETDLKPRGLAIPLGVYFENGVQKILWHDFTENGYTNLLVGGINGSGKSNLLNTVLNWVVLTTKPHQVKIHAIDGKGGVELFDYKNCKHTKSFARSLEQSADVIKNIYKMMESRYDTFHKAKVRNLKEYNEKGNHMSYELLVIDEFNIFANKKNPIVKNTLPEIEAIMQRGRACGICVIICTQTPYTDLLGGYIKGNCNTTIGFRTKTQSQSQVICDENGLEKIKDVGIGYYYGLKETTKFKCFYAGKSEQIQERIKHTYITNDIKPKQEEKKQLQDTSKNVEVLPKKKKEIVKEEIKIDKVEVEKIEQEGKGKQIEEVVNSLENLKK